MNILMVYPEFPDTFWSFKHALRFIRKKAVSPPLGLLTVAAMLPTGWVKRLVDLNVSSLLQKDLDWADFVFISGMVVQRDSARAVIARAKKAGKKVVAGGPLFTIEHEQFPEVDHFVLNEAELTLPPSWQIWLMDVPSDYTQPANILTSPSPRRRSGSLPISRITIRSAFSFLAAARLAAISVT